MEVHESIYLVFITPHQLLSSVTAHPSKLRPEPMLCDTSQKGILEVNCKRLVVSSESANGIMGFRDMPAAPSFGTTNRKNED